MHIVGLASSFALFFLVCLGTAGLLGVAVMGLARMERATVPARASAERPRPSRPAPAPDSVASRFGTERVSSPGRCTYGPRL